MKFKRKQKQHLFNRQVALCMIVFLVCSLPSSQSINVNNKHNVQNKQIQTSTLLTKSNSMPLESHGNIEMDEDDDYDDDEEDERNGDYSNGEYGSSGSENLLPNSLDEFDHIDRKDKTPFFYKVPENAFVMKNRHAFLKCQVVDALDVSIPHPFPPPSPKQYQIPCLKNQLNMRLSARLTENCK